MDEPGHVKVTVDVGAVSETATVQNSALVTMGTMKPHNFHNDNTEGGGATLGVKSTMLTPEGPATSPPGVARGNTAGTEVADTLDNSGAPCWDSPENYLESSLINLS